MQRREFLRLSTLGGVALAQAALIMSRARAASTSYAMGSAASFTFDEILVYRLQVTVSTWACSYLSTSGSYIRYESIGALISDLEAGTLGSPDSALPPFGAGDTCPDIIVRRPCYVVVVLTSDDDSSFAFATTPLSTAENLSTRYYGLTEPYASPGDGLYRVCYFSVPSINDGASDGYNLFLRYGTGPTLHTIDPCIKNRSK